MIPLINHDSSEGEQWGRYNLRRTISKIIILQIYKYMYITNLKIDMVSTSHFSAQKAPEIWTVQLGTDLGALGQKLLQKLLERKIATRHGREIPRFMEL